MFGERLGSTDSYIVLGITFLALSAGIFVIRKDLRVQMIVTAISFFFISVIIDPIYTSNYNISGIANLSLTFNLGSVLMITGTAALASTIYNFLLSEKYERKINSLSDIKLNPKKLILPIGVIVGFTIITLFTPLTTLQSFLIIMVVYLFGLFFTRRDLLRDSLYSGALILLCVIIIINTINLVSPGWYYREVTNISSPFLIFGITIDTILFFFFIGTYIGSIFEYWQDVKPNKITPVESPVTPQSDQAQAK